MSRGLQSITEPIRREFDHEVGLAVLVSSNGSSYADAAVNARDGGVLAWDGWYSLDALSPQPASKHVTPLLDLPEWEDAEYSPGDALLERNAAWLAALAWSLRPSYSLSKLAASTLESHGERGGAEYATDWHVAAYFPTELTLEEAGKLAMERRLSWGER
jgi:hypothetical protein